MKVWAVYEDFSDYACRCKITINVVDTKEKAQGLVDRYNKINKYYFYDYDEWTVE